MNREAVKPRLTLPEFLEGVEANAMWTPPPPGEQHPRCGGCLRCRIETTVIMQDLMLDFGRLPSMG